MFTGVSLPEKSCSKRLKSRIRKSGTGKLFSVDLAVTDGDTVRQFNREYRGIDAETDVLSFPYFDKLQFPVKKKISRTKPLTESMSRSEAL